MDEPLVIAIDGVVFVDVSRGDDAAVQEFVNVLQVVFAALHVDRFDGPLGWIDEIGREGSLVLHCHGGSFRWFRLMLGGSVTILRDGDAPTLTQFFPRYLSGPANKKGASSHLTPSLAQDSQLSRDNAADAYYALHADFVSLRRLSNLARANHSIASVDERT